MSVSNVLCLSSLVELIFIIYVRIKKAKRFGLFFGKRRKKKNKIELSIRGLRIQKYSNDIMVKIFVLNQDKE